MRRLIIALSVMALIFTGVSIAGATSVDFLIGTQYNTIEYNDTLMDINYDIDSKLPNKSFSLDEGGGITFNYALINSITPGGIDANIVAYLEFVLPSGVGTVGSDGNVIVKTVKMNGMCMSNVGTGCGADDTEFWIYFEPQVEVPFGDGGLFTVELSDVYAISVDGGCCYPTSDTATIEATVTLNAIPVPEPSSLLQLGAGLLCLSAYRIRRKR